MNILTVTGLMVAGWIVGDCITIGTILVARKRYGHLVDRLVNNLADRIAVRVVDRAEEVHANKLEDLAEEFDDSIEESDEDCRNGGCCGGCN